MEQAESGTMTTTGSAPNGAMVEQHADQSTDGVAPLVSLLASGRLNAEHVEQALALQRQHDEYAAKRAFSVALARFRSQVQNVKKDREGHHKGARYATLGAVASTVAQPLADNGLSYYWTDNQGEDRITVTCHLMHELGHEITTTLSSGPDTQGAKSPIQAVASARSYLCRYTLLGLLGLATEDDDAHATRADAKPAPEVMPTPEYESLKERVKSTGGDVARWEAWVLVEYPNGVPVTDRAKLEAQIDSAKTRREAQAAAKVEAAE